MRVFHPSKEGEEFSLAYQSCSRLAGEIRFDTLWSLSVKTADSPFAAVGVPAMPLECVVLDDRSTEGEGLFACVDGHGHQRLAVAADVRVRGRILGAPPRDWGLWVSAGFYCVARLVVLVVWSTPRGES